MDVKGLGHINLEKQVEDRRSEASKQIKSEMTADRDSSNQYESEQDQRELSEEEIFEAFERLKQKSAIKDSALVAKLEKVNERYFVIISDYSGKVVRRFSAQELALIPPDTESKKGLILNKAM